MLKKFAVISILVLFISSCTAFPFGSPISGQTDGLQNAGILFWDDFSDVTSGWDRQRTGDGVTDYEDGQYLIQVDRANMNFFANPSISLANVRLEVEATNNGGEVNNEFGLICRFQDRNDYYAGLISSDGYFGIFKVKGGETILLGRDVMGQSAAIKTGLEKNLMRLDCVGKEIRLYANGIQLDACQDGDFAKGDVGLMAGAYRKPGVKILFDNFMALEP